MAPFRLVWILSLLIHCGLCSAGSECTNKYPPSVTKNLRWETVDLDKPAKERWSHIVAPMGDQIKAMVDSVIDLLPVKLAKDILTRLDGKEDEILDAFPSDYGDEIRGIQAAIGIDMASLILYNMAYELEGACTSIVAENGDNVPFHARNLDFGLFLGWDKVNRTWQLAEKLRPLLFNARFIKNGEILFNATYFGGYVGLLTGMKTGGFSVTVDTRYDSNLDRGLFAWLQGNHTGHFVSFTTRMAMENDATYVDALNTLNNTVMIGPSYIILGGVSKGEGAVITRAESQSLNLWTIQNNLRGKGFYVLQTNYDNWVEPPFYDDRRKPAEACMDAIGQNNIEFNTLFNVLSHEPNLNLLTTYTTLMNVKEGRFEAYIQTCTTHPCSPW